jgi:subtilisin family serine protease
VTSDTRIGIRSAVRPWVGVVGLCAAMLVAWPAAASAASADEPVRVLVRFARPPGAAELRLVDEAEAVVRHDFPDLDVFALEMPRHRAAALALDPRVELVEEDPERHALDLSSAELQPTPENGLYGLLATRALAAHGRGAIGRGARICAVDTGLDAGHPDIAPVYRGGIDSVDDDENPDTGAGPAAPTHGTAVAAILAGALNGSGVRGVAYGSELFHARGLPDSGSGRSSDIMAAVRHLVEERGCRVVNLSLGGDGSSEIERDFYEEMASRGVLVVAASGNDSGSQVGFPAGYPGVLAIGAVDRRNQHAGFSNTGAGLALSAPGVDVLSALPRGRGSEAEVAVQQRAFAANGLEFAAQTSGLGGTLVDCGSGNTAAEFPSAVAGQVALIRRGDAFFSVKVENAMNAGAIAAVIYNHEAGGFLGTLQNATASDGRAWIPAVGVTDADGRSLRGLAGGSARVVNAASHWGGFNGTSAAAPYVSGVAALVLGLRPSLSRDELASILQRTAQPLGPPGYDTTFGFGLVNAEAAIREAGSPAPTGPCRPGRSTLCLHNKRFRVDVAWQNQFDGSSGGGVALPQSDVAGFFSFGDPSNIELLVKILDFGEVVKVFYGQLTNLRFSLTVTDTRTGAVKVYNNTPGECGAIDETAFQSLGDSFVDASTAATGAATTCRPGANNLCLLRGRFEVRVAWRNPWDGSSGAGGTARLSDLTGAFYFTDRQNLELLTKVLDLGGRIVFFYGTLSNLEYTITVTDLSTGAVKTYHNPGGSFCGGLDTSGF